MNLVGEIAGLATSFFFALTSIIFASTGRMVGSQVTNRIRLIFALLYLVILNLVLFHEPLPFSAEILALAMAWFIRCDRSFAR